MDLSIIIVSWNVRDLLEKCIKSIYLHTKDLNFEVFVVDNASTDNSAEMIKKEFPQVKLIVNKENAGFGKANNQAYELASGKYVLFLNDDTEIFDNIFLALIHKYERLEVDHDKVGMLGCKLLNADKSIQKSVRKNPSLRDQIILLTKLHNVFPDLLKDYWQLDFDYAKEQEVEQIMGSFMLSKKEIIDEVGSFDENFFVWYEEVDIERRMQKAGYKIFYTPVVECMHVGGVSFNQLMAVKKQLNYNKSMLYYFKKHH